VSSRSLGRPTGDRSALVPFPDRRPRPTDPVLIKRHLLTARSRPPARQWRRPSTVPSPQAGNGGRHVTKGGLGRHRRAARPAIPRDPPNKHALNRAGANSHKAPLSAVAEGPMKLTTGWSGDSAQDLSRGCLRCPVPGETTPVPGSWHRPGHRCQEPWHRLPRPCSRYRRCERFGQARRQRHHPRPRGTGTRRHGWPAADLPGTDNEARTGAVCSCRRCRWQLVNCDPRRRGG